MTRTNEELWNCAIHALSELKITNSRFSPWVVKGVRIHPSGVSADFVFLDASARQMPIDIGAVDAGVARGLIDGNSQPLIFM